MSTGEGYFALHVCLQWRRRWWPRPLLLPLLLPTSLLLLAMGL